MNYFSRPACRTRKTFSEYEYEILTSNSKITYTVLQKFKYLPILLNEVLNRIKKIILAADISTNLKYFKLLFIIIYNYYECKIRGVRFATACILA